MRGTKSRRGLAMFATDKQIIERMLIPAMMQAVILGMQKSFDREQEAQGAKPEDGPMASTIFGPVMVLLATAMKEAVAGVDPYRVNKLVRRSKRVCTQAMEVVACLLYTSPSPRDGLLSRMPSSA